MVWHKANGLSRRSMVTKGLDGIVTATQLCQAAERLAPVPIRGISSKNGILHIALTRDFLMKYRMSEAGFIDAVNEFCDANRIAKITKVRLTIEPASGKI